MKKVMIWYLCLFIILVIVDQVSKSWIVNSLALYGSIELIDGFFSLTYVTNTGAAWSVFSGGGWFFVIVGSLAMILFSIWFSKTKRWLSQLALIFMIAGTFGNWFDRLQFGFVRDFLDFIIFGYDFPIFNGADSFLCIGVALLFIDVIWEEFYGK